MTKFDWQNLSAMTSKELTPEGAADHEKMKPLNIDDQTSATPDAFDLHQEDDHHHQHTGDPHMPSERS